MTPDWERQELPSLLCPFPLWMWSASFSSLSAYACCWIVPWCSMVCGSPSSVPATTCGMAGATGAVSVTFMMGTEVLAANPRHRADDISPFPIFLGVSVGATVSLNLSWPGASQQHIGFLSEGMVIPLIILYLNIFSFKIWLPSVGKNQQNSGRFNFINHHKSFPFWL